MRDGAHPAPASLLRAGAVLTVDLDALCANYRLLRARVAPAACAAVVKADAYGLGAGPVAGALFDAGCRDFFVAHLDEGIRLRPDLPEAARIFVLHGAMPGTEDEFLEHGLVPVLNSLHQVQAWRALAGGAGRPLAAALQIDTGMHRMGLSLDELETLVADDAPLRGIDLQLVMSHLACADEPGHPHNAHQLERFRSLSARLPAGPASLANSSGSFLDPGFRFDLARAGAALYGIAPTAGAPNPLHQVVRLQARVVQVRRIEAGAQVGYGCRYTAPAPRFVATAAMGYADGWPRQLSGRTVGVFQGTALPQIGTVSMDSITLDVSALPPGRLQPGDLVDLIGPGQTVDDIAALAGTIGYEILTGLGPRLARRYLRSD
ncbi:MAG TPA: alanine racemase [Telluria sp.]|nr:alanine racemase [Telluria sp.]